MMLSYLLDTNIVIYIIKNRPPRVRQRFNDLADRLAISTVTLGELIYGVEKSLHPERNQAVIDGLAARIEVLPFEPGRRPISARFARTCRAAADLSAPTI